MPDLVKQRIGGGSAGGGDTVFAMHANWKNSEYYNCSMSIAETTLNHGGSLTSGATSTTLTDASTYKVGHGIEIPGAGAAGKPFVDTLIDIVGNVVTWATPTSTTVSDGITVHHNENAALNAAINDFGYNFFWMAGKYNINGDAGAGVSALVGSVSGKVVMGSQFPGYRTAYALGGIETEIINRGQTSDALSIESPRMNFSGIYIQQATGITPTAGSAIAIGNYTTSGASTYLASFSIDGTYNGIKCQDATDSRVENGYITTTVSAPVWVDSVIPYNCGVWRGVKCASVDGSSASGLHMTACDIGTKFIHCHFGQYQYPYNIDASSGAILGVTFTDCSADNTGKHLTGGAVARIINIPASGNEVRGCSWKGGTYSSALNAGHTTQAAYIGTDCLGVKLIDLYLNAHDGIENLGDNTVITDNYVRIAAAGGSGYGIKHSVGQTGGISKGNNLSSLSGCVNSIVVDATAGAVESHGDICAGAAVVDTGSNLTRFGAL